MAVSSALHALSAVAELLVTQRHSVAKNIVCFRRQCDFSYRIFLSLSLSLSFHEIFQFPFSFSYGKCFSYSFSFSIVFRRI